MPIPSLKPNWAYDVSPILLYRPTDVKIVPPATDFPEPLPSTQFILRPHINCSNPQWENETMTAGLGGNSASRGVTVALTN